MKEHTLNIHNWNKQAFVLWLCTCEFLNFSTHELVNHTASGFKKHHILLHHNYKITPCQSLAKNKSKLHFFFTTQNTFCTCTNSQNQTIQTALEWHAFTASNDLTQQFISCFLFLRCFSFTAHRYKQAEKYSNQSQKTTTHKHLITLTYSRLASVSWDCTQ